VLDQPDSLAEHGPADLVAIEQLGLGTQQLADRPALRDHIAHDAVGDPRGALGSGADARPPRSVSLAFLRWSWSSAQGYPGVHMGGELPTAVTAI
jgi:hypothetical protein